MRKTSFLLLLMSLVSASHGDQLTPWSGTLERPVLFVHGVAADMTSWGAVPDKSKVVFLVTPNSTMLQNAVVGKYADFSGALGFADYYQIPADGRHFIDLSQGVNHNGIEFYNSLAYKEINGQLVATGYDPFAIVQKTNGLVDDARGMKNLGQTNQLFARMEAVLTEYFGSGWTTNPNAKIDIVCHSQGCLVTRSVIASYRGTGLDNPVNHLNQIVSADSPALGTALSMDGSGVYSIQRLRDVAFSIKPLLNPINISINLPSGTSLLTCSAAPVTLQFMVLNFLTGRKMQMTCGGTTTEYTLFRMDPFKDLRKTFESFIARQDGFGYPNNFSTPKWLPTTSKITTTGVTNGSIFQTNLKSSLGNLTRPIDNTRVPMTALYGTAPGLFVALLNKAVNDAISACSDNAITATFDSAINSLTFWKDKYGFSTCGDLINAVANPLRPILTAMDAEWSGNSDGIVDVGSQKYEGFLSSTNYPFTVRQFVPAAGDRGVSHMTFEGVGYNGRDLPGACTFGSEFGKALRSTPKQKNIAPALSLLLN